MSKWTQRRRSCQTIYTHEDNNYQVIHEHQDNRIVYKGQTYENVEEAKQQAERDVNDP